MWKLPLLCLEVCLRSSSTATNYPSFSRAALQIPKPKRTVVCLSGGCKGDTSIYHSTFQGGQKMSITYITQLQFRGFIDSARTWTAEGFSRGELQYEITYQGQAHLLQPRILPCSIYTQKRKHVWRILIILNYGIIRYAKGLAVEAVFNISVVWFVLTTKYWLSDNSIVCPLSQRTVHCSQKTKKTQNNSCFFRPVAPSSWSIFLNKTKKGTVHSSKKPVYVQGYT